MAHSHGCPRCRSEVLKSAPIPIIGPLLKPFSERRRYRCRECGWTGWKHRLQRRNSAFVAQGRRDGVEPQTAWFFIAVVVFLVVVTILLPSTSSAAAPAARKRRPSCSCASAFADVDENDPASMARLMKKMSEASGEDLGEDFEHAMQEEGGGGGEDHDSNE